MLYTVFFDVCGIMLIGVGSPVIWIAWVIFFLIVSNSSLILLCLLYTSQKFGMTEADIREFYQSFAPTEPMLEMFGL